MTVALFARNLRHHARLLLALFVGFVALESLLVTVAHQLESGPGFRALFELLPPAFRSLLESQIGSLSLKGLVAFGFQHPAVLVGSLTFAMVVGSIPAGERETGLLDLFLARPVPRGRYLLAVLLLQVLGALLLPLALLGGLALSFRLLSLPEPLSWTTYLRPGVGLASLILAVGGYTMLFSTATRRRGQAVARAAGITLTLYLVEFLGSLWKGLAPIRWLAPFHYHRPIQVVIGGEAFWQNTAVLVGIFAVSAAAAFWSFARQDL